MKIKYKQLIKDSEELSKQIDKNRYKSIYGIPTGGLIPAFVISKKLGLPFVDMPNKNTLVVDDLIDSGRTLEGFSNDCAVLYRKSYSPETNYCLREVKGWIDLPHETLETGIENNISRILQFIGENPRREGLIGTPKRVARMYKEIFRGYNLKKKPKITIFNNKKDGVDYDQMIIDKGYFFSHCEHHIVPFFGKYYFAYIPDKKIIGLSKVARIIDWYSAKLQIQERLVKEVVDEIEQKTKPLGIALVMKGRHLCKEMRGVKKIEGEMITSDLRGVFRSKATVREEFLKLIKL